MQVTIEHILTWGLSIIGTLLFALGTVCAAILRGILSHLQGIKDKVEDIERDASQHWAEIATLDGIVRTLPCRLCVNSNFPREVRNESNITKHGAN